MKLCVRTSFNVPQTAIQPAIPDVTIPTSIGTASPSGMPSLARPAPFSSTAPVVTGIIMRKLMRAAASRSNPMKRPAVIVIPDLDVPGFSASACAAPTISESRTP